MRIAKLMLLAPFAALLACEPTYGVDMNAGYAGYYAEQPTLAYVEPGVEVVAGWDTPVFFADDYYWYWDNGYWYQSATFGGSRVPVRQVPVGLTHIGRPDRYAHYQPPPGMRSRPMQGTYAGGRPTRYAPPAGGRYPTPSPGYRPPAGPRPTMGNPYRPTMAPQRPMSVGRPAPRPVFRGGGGRRR